MLEHSRAVVNPAKACKPNNVNHTYRNQLGNRNWTMPQEMDCAIRRETGCCKRYTYRLHKILPEYKNQYNTLIQEFTTRKNIECLEVKRTCTSWINSHKKWIHVTFLLFYLFIYLSFEIIDTALWFKSDIVQCMGMLFITLAVLFYFICSTACGLWDCNRQSFNAN